MTERAASSAARFVDTPEALLEVCADLARETAIALDTEFVRERTHVPRLELVQLARRDGRIAVIDYGTLGRVPGDPLAAALADPRVLKVFHAAEQDLEMLALLTGQVPAPIWDTQLTTGLFGYTGRTGYTAVVESFLGTRPKSGEALTDWSRRPLTPEQLVYAAEDVRHLLRLYDLEHEKLATLRRVAWAEEECEQLRHRVAAQLARRADDAKLYQRIRGWGRLSRRQLAILRELAVWRERVAARRNRPPGTVMRDDVLVEVARRAPTSPPELRTLRLFPGKDLERHGEELVAAVAAGKRVPRDECPELPPAAFELGDAETALISFLQAVLRGVAAAKSVAPGLLTNAAEIERLVVAHIQREPFDDLRLMSGWRREVAGEEILGVLGGRRSVRWDPANRSLRLEEV